MFHRSGTRRLRLLALAGTAVFAVASWAATTASVQAPRQSKPVPGQVKPRAPLKVAQTFLRVGIPQPDKDPIWVASIGMNVPEYFTFQWTTSEPAVAGGRWVVTNAPHGSAGATVVASGVLAPNQVASLNKPARFPIHFATFAPKKPPAAPYSLKYYVVVVPTAADQKELRPSTTVVITYSEGEQTQFDDNMGSEPGWAATVLQQAYDHFKAKGLGSTGGYVLGDPVGPVKTAPGIAAYRRFRTTAGPEVSIEIGSESSVEPVIWVCAPHTIAGWSSNSAYLWFKYVRSQRSGQIVPAPNRDQYQFLGIWPKPQTGTDVYSHDTNFITGVHWSSVLIKDDKTLYATSIERLHLLYQGPPYNATDYMNNHKQAVQGQDISERAMKPWQHVTLRGILIGGHFPDSDVAYFHTTDYNDGESVPTGPPNAVVSDHSWPGMDWDMKVTPDPAYKYLEASESPDIGVEIEHFALLGPDDPTSNYWQYQPLSYFPTEGHYLQTIGRWVTDNAHSGKLEIHPPELLAETHLASDYTSYTVVTATGAWSGADLVFVVNPPPRPAADAKLRSRVQRLDGAEGFDRKDNAELYCDPVGPPGSPNHFLCRVHATAQATLVLQDNGVVGMTGTRGLKCIVKAWWEYSSATVSGSVTDGSQPARGAYVFYRDESVPKSTWRVAWPNSQGAFTIADLALGKQYRFVVEGSGWYFPSGRVLRTFNGKNDPPLTFVGNRVKESLVPNIVPFESYLRARGPVNFGIGRLQAGKAGAGATGRQAAAAKAGVAQGAGQGVSVVGENAARQLLRSVLVSLIEPGGSYGVLTNGLGYRDRGTFLYQLKGLVGADGKPVPDLRSAYSADSSGPTPVITLNGLPTETVSGARVRARLVVGNQWTGYRVAATTEAVTGYNGMARLRFTAGGRVEDGTVDVEVLSNPYNPWFLPKLAGSSHLFYPAPFPTGVTPYRIEAGLPIAASAAARARVGGGGGRAEGEAADAATVRRNAEKTNSIAKRPGALPKVRQAKVVGVE